MHIGELGVKASEHEGVIDLPQDTDSCFLLRVHYMLYLHEFFG